MSNFIYENCFHDTSIVQARASFSKGLLGIDHGLHTVVHILNEIFLGTAETSLVRDVVSGISAFRVLTVDTTDLHVILGGNFFELFHVLGKLWQLDVDGGTESGTQVGWAGSDVAQVLVMRKFSNIFDSSGGAGKTVENGVNVGTWLHGDDSELIFLIDPDKEGLVVVVEDSSARWPVTVQTASIQEAVTLPKI